MTGPNDERLDHELREALRRRDPGAPPSALRTWVLGVPDDEGGSKLPQPRRPVAAALGLAAVILLAVIGLATIRHIGPTGVPGSSVATESTAAASAVASPFGAFDPALEGPGVSPTDDISPAVLVVLACIVLAFLAFTVRGRRRLIPVVLAAVLAAWGIAATLVPVTIVDSGYGLGLNTVAAAKVPGSAEELLYELAPANGRFSIGLYLSAEGPVPVRIEGIVSPAFGWDRSSFVGIVLAALWIDREPNGGMSGPIRPFVAFDMPVYGQSIWLVGQAGGCALGGAFDPSNPATVEGFQRIDSIDIRVSVLGWPRTVHLPLPFRLVEPDAQSCSGPRPTVSISSPASPSGQ
jgi:hypothetical protein